MLRKIPFILLLTTISFSSFSQIGSNNLFLAKEYSKDISLYKTKYYLMSEVLGITNTDTKFELFPLAASNTGEITSLVYFCEAKNKDGLILGFYGDTWKQGNQVTAYAFKDFSKTKALEILAKIEASIETNSKYLSKDNDNHNVYFQYDDVIFLIYKKSGDNKIRVFWNNFDAEWEFLAFERTKKRFEKKLD
jgi:hypothetical protein